MELRLSSSFPSGYLQQGRLASRLATLLSEVSDGGIVVHLHESEGVGVAATLEKRDAIAAGTLDAMVTASGYFAGHDSALHLFTGFPFGPDALEHMAWLEHGGGMAILRALYAEQHLVCIPCASISAKGSGWYREPVESTAQLRGLRLRFFGLGAKVMEQLGARTTMLSADATRAAMRAGDLDGFDAFTPALDHQQRFHDHAAHYYLPGWQQPCMSFDLLIGEDCWNRLSPAHRRCIEIACGALAREALVESEAIQADALKALEAEGAQVHIWSEELMAAFRLAWGEVARAESAANPRFGRTLESYATFHTTYARWQRQGHLSVQ